MTILIDRLVKSDVCGYSFLANLYKQIASQEEDRECLVDFINCIHFDANLSAALGAILDRLEEEGHESWIQNVKGGVRRTLSRNCFLKVFSKEAKDLDTDDFIEYKKFRCNESTSFKQYIKAGLIEKQNFPKHTERAGNKVLESIYEIYANATNHGDCSYVYCCGELHGDTNPVLDVTIVDCGNTIMHNVNEYCRKRGLAEMNACESIVWSMKSGNTTKNVPGGLGLAILQEFIMLNKGALQIVSADGMLEYRNGKTTTTFLTATFPGTIVNMEFNCKDDNIYKLSSEELVDINDLL